MSRKAKMLAYGAVLGAVLFWGLSFVATKIALATIPIFTLIFIRFSFAAAFYCAIWLKIGFPRLSKRDWVKISLLSIFEPGLYFLFETYGLSMTAAPKASLLIATIPVFVLVMAVLFLKERASALNFVGVGVSLVGIGILVTGLKAMEWDFSGQLMGDLLIFGAVVTASVYIVMARDLGATHTALTITGLQAVFGAIMYLPAFVWEWPRIQWHAMTVHSLWALGYLIIFATIVAFLCWNYSLTQIPASSASVFLNGIPVVTAIAAWILLNESLTFMQMGGGGLVLAGVYLANLKR